jgi:hypothetical protein
MDWFVAARLDAAGILARLAREDALALPMLAEAARDVLLREQADYAYRPSREVVGSGEAIVRQQLDWFADFPESCAFADLTAAFQGLWDRALDDLGESPFAGPLRFNEMMLNRYEAGSLGITPHRDHASYRNLVALFVLEGEGRFHVAADRSGRSARPVPAPPGHVILMRAPGFSVPEGVPDRPFHFVTDITSRRTVFGLRQEEPPGARAARTAAREAQAAPS